MTSADPSIAKLTEQARNGDHSAYEQLIRLTSGRIKGLVYRRLRYPCMTGIDGTN